MSELIYQALAAVGFHHPLHPAIAHLPVGLVFGGFLFGLGAYFLRRDTMARSARHCMTLGLLALIPTIFLGYIDWQQFYALAGLFPIKMKIMLAVVLLLLLPVAVYASIKAPKALKTLAVYFLCVLLVVGLGYYGGELVFGKREPPATAAESRERIPEVAAAGALAFSRMCSGCHYADNANFKMGPGLKGLFKKKALYGSGWPVTEANVKKQIVTPFGTMPAFSDMSDEELNAMLAYMKTLWRGL